MRRDEVHAEFDVTSTVLSRHEIECRIGLAPAHSWSIGDVRGRTTIVERDNGCRYKSKLPVTASLDDHIRDLLGQLRPHAGCIRELAGNCQAIFSLAIYHYSTPALYFDREMIQQFDDLGAAFDIDLYEMAGGE